MPNWSTLPSDPTGALVIVTNISPQATEKIVKDFFLFCGKIKSFEMQKSDEDDTKVALVLFERESAAKTACVLSNALIVDTQINVKPYFDGSSSKASMPEANATECSQGETGEHSGGIKQEEKTKAVTVVTEILAAGYTLSEQIMERAKEFDGKFHLADRFQSAFNQAKAQALAIDEKYKIQANIQTTAKNLDAKFHVTEKAQMVGATAKSIADQALATEPGKKMAEVVTQAQTKARQVQGDAKQMSEEKRKGHAYVVGEQPGAPAEPPVATATQ